ncbi:hypothetical protein [Streptomyces sp. H27-D2]|uniref:hypothetical protein n=1 Tax=Streptomyces sp. H27-D2 TaxID=3046304 RepID=UPI002DBFAB71|nr:hypothetical protein [Streptomyces sp. H27-D2]MEC4015725.1 hypothetical protein [Streptomyces sp. H27-D2]
MRSRSGLGTVLAVAAACAAVLTAPAQALAAPGDGTGGLPTYRTAEDAEKVKGTTSSANGPQLKTGVYTDSIGAGQKLYYSVTLDSKSSAFLSAVVAPKPGTKVAYGDGITVTLQDTGGNDCSTSNPTFSSGEQARPIADYATRRIEEDGDCQTAGPYYFVVERTSDPASDAGRWPMELKYMSEPGIKSGSTTPPAEGSWSSASPTPPSGSARRRAGGTGFNDAPALTDGVWKDRLKPGETRFYRMPLDWGQQLSAAAELANASMTLDSGYAATGLDVQLYNTARGAVSARSEGYDGKQQTADLGPTAPAGFNNRFDASDDEVSGMRFAGWYYLAVSLNPEVGKFTTGAVDLTLRLTVKGEPKDGPQYVGDETKAGFGVSDADREQAEKGQTAAAAEESDSKKLVAYAGIGVGVVLLLGLGGWTLAARRRAPGAATPGEHPGGGSPQGGGHGGGDPQGGSRQAANPPGGRQPDGHRQDGHRQDGHRQDGHRQDGHRQDGHRQDGHRQDGHQQGGNQQGGNQQYGPPPGW